MKMNSVRLVTFDITGTILNFRIPPAQKYAQIGAQFGVIVDSNELASSFRKQYLQMSSCHPNYGLTGFGWEKWWKELVRKSFEQTLSPNIIDYSVLCTIADYLVELYKKADCYEMSQGALELLVYLYNHGVPMGIITNNDDRIESVLKGMELHQYFKFVITSYSAGFEKPDPRIFQLALSKIKNVNVKPNEALHVGNAPDRDYLGAKNAGWNAALVHQNARKVASEHKYIDPSHVFESLKDLQFYLTVGLHK